MMNMRLTATAGLLAVLLPSAAQAVPKPSVLPARILVTLQAVEVSGQAAPPSYPASGTFDALLKEGDEATEVSVQTPNDFPGVARYSRVFTFKTLDHGKPGRGFLTAPTSLEATPHINSDGTITVDLKMEMTRVTPAAAGAAPATTVQSMTTRRTFKSGQAVMLSDTILAAQGASPKAKWLVQFLTVTVLPGAVAAR